jgi:hypothetical protein
MYRSCSASLLSVNVLFLCFHDPIAMFQERTLPSLFMTLKAMALLTPSTWATSCAGWTSTPPWPSLRRWAARRRRVSSRCDAVTLWLDVRSWGRLQLCYPIRVVVVGNPASFSGGSEFESAIDYYSVSRLFPPCKLVTAASFSIVVNDVYTETSRLITNVTNCCINSDASLNNPVSNLHNCQWLWHGDGVARVQSQAKAVFCTSTCPEWNWDHWKIGC